MSNFDNASWGQYGDLAPLTTQETASSWSSYTQNSYSNQSKRKASDNQIKFYLDLCKQKRQEVNENHAEWTFEEMSEEIGRLRGLKVVAGMTDKQRNTIKDVLERTPEININELAPNWAKSSIEEASTLIGELFNLERKHRDKRQCTEAQADKMLRMYLCPDVRFEETGWVDRYETYEGKKMLVIPPSEVIKEWLQKNVNSAKANEFISKYNASYVGWATTRVSPEQKRFIQTLEERMANLHSAGREVVQSTDIDGNLVADNPTTRGAHPKEYAPIGHKPLTPLQMFQLSKDQAAEYIEILQVTLADREQIKFTPEPMNGDRVEALRKGTGNTAIDNDIAAMANFIHGLYAAMGEELDEHAQRLAETPSEVMEDPANKSLVDQVRAIIAHAISIGVGFGAVDNMLDNVPSLRVALEA